MYVPLRGETIQSFWARREVRTSASSFFLDFSTSGKERLRPLRVSRMAPATTRRVNHLLSAGTTYHGACFEAVC